MNHYIVEFEKSFVNSVTDTIEISRKFKVTSVNFTFNVQILEATLARVVSIIVSSERQWVARISQQGLTLTRW